MEAVLADSDPENEEGEICNLPPNDGDQSELEGIDEEYLQPVEPSDVCGQLEVFGHTETPSSSPDITLDEWSQKSCQTDAIKELVTSQRGKRKQVCKKRSWKI